MLSLDDEEVEKSKSILINQLNVPNNPDGTIDGFVKNLIEELLWLEGGENEQTKSICSTPRNLRTQRMNDKKQSTMLDNRLQYWQNYLERREKIKNRIKYEICKDDDEILLNHGLENCRVQLIKRLLNTTDRLDPTALSIREPVFLKKVCNRGDVIETLPKLEKVGKKVFEVCDLPKISRIEQGFGSCAAESKGSWLNSKYLSNKILEKKNDIQDLIHFYPDVTELQVIGKKKSLINRLYEESKSTIDNVVSPRNVRNFDSYIELRIVDADSLRSKEKLPNYCLTINDIVLDYNKPLSYNVDLNVVFPSTIPHETQQSIMINIKNSGTKSIKLQWLQKSENDKRLTDHLQKLESYYSTFYFNKNPFRLGVGDCKQIPVYFNCKKNGIYSEIWILETVPTFFKNNSNIIILLFGHCELNNFELDKINKLQLQLNNDSNKDMAKNLLNSIICPISMTIPEPPYIQSLTDEEIFMTINPKMKFGENHIEEFKILYYDMKLILQSTLSESSCNSNNWNFCINDLKSMIFQIDDEQLRIDFYARFINIMNEIKNYEIKESQEYYENQRYLLVRSVILLAMEKMDNSVIQLKESLIKTSLSLEYKEVILTNTSNKPNYMQFNINEMAHGDSNLSLNKNYDFQVIASEKIIKKKEKLIYDEIYFQIAQHLCQMFDEIVAVIEGNKNLLRK